MANEKFIPEGANERQIEDFLANAKSVSLTASELFDLSNKSIAEQKVKADRELLEQRLIAVIGDIKAVMKALVNAANDKKNSFECCIKFPETLEYLKSIGYEIEPGMDSNFYFPIQRTCAYGPVFIVTWK